MRLRSLLPALFLITACEVRERVVPLTGENATLESECASGKTKSCRELGMRFYYGEGVEQNRSRSAPLFARACEAGDKGGCYFLAKQLAEGDGIPKDAKRAANIWDAECDKGFPPSCGSLANLYALGDGVPRNYPRAVKLLTKACDGGDPYACFGLGNWSRDGRHMRQSHSRAARYFRKGCEGEAAGACVQLAKQYALGRGVKASTAEARRYYAKACELGDKRSCSVVEPEPEVTASGSRTRRAWDETLAATAMFTGIGNVRRDEMRRRTRNALAAYARIDQTDIDPELAAFIAQWRQVAAELLDIDGRTEKIVDESGSAAAIAGIVGAWLNHREGETEESLEEGFRRGAEVGTAVAQAASAEARGSLQSQRSAIENRGRALFDRETVLQRRLELRYHRSFPIPKG